MNQVLLLRHGEAVDFYICTKTARYWFQMLLLMDFKLLRSMASFNPSSLRAIIIHHHYDEVGLNGGPNNPAPSSPLEL